MRTLTLKRRKSFVGCLGVMKVYIEDPESNELTISQTPCRMLGTLKNGEEQQFSIPDTAAKLFVIAGKSSKAFCTDCYELPEGCEDLALSGENKFNPAKGNAFLFDNNPSAFAADLRKKGGKLGWLILIVSVIVGITVGTLLSRSLFGSRSVPKPKTFSEGGMEITLTDAFAEVKQAGYTVCYSSKGVAILALREEFTLMGGLASYTTEQYADLLIQANDLDVPIETVDGMTCLGYTRPGENGEQYRFTVYLFKSEDAFWMVQFAVSEEEYPSYAKEIPKWAKSIRFS